MREIRFTAQCVCNMYQQDKCRGFKKWGLFCEYGLPDRPCRNATLRLEMFEKAICKEKREAAA